MIIRDLNPVHDMPVTVTIPAGLTSCRCRTSIFGMRISDLTHIWVEGSTRPQMA